MRNKNVTRMSIAAVFTLAAALALTAVKAPPVAATALTQSQWVTQRDNAWWMAWRAGNIAQDGGPVYAGCRTADRYAELNGRPDPLGWCERELDIAGTAANCAGFRYDTHPGGRWQFTGPQAVNLLALFPPASTDLGAYMRHWVDGGDPGGYPWAAQDMLRLAAQAAGIYPMPDCTPDQQLLNVASTGDRWAVIQSVAPAYGVDPNVLWKIEACETHHYSDPASESRTYTGGYQQLRSMWLTRSAAAGVQGGVWPGDGPAGVVADVQTAAWLYQQQGPSPWPVCGYL